MERILAYISFTGLLGLLITPMVGVIYMTLYTEAPLAAKIFPIIIVLFLEMALGSAVIFTFRDVLEYLKREGK